MPLQSTLFVILDFNPQDLPGILPEVLKIIIRRRRRTATTSAQSGLEMEAVMPPPFPYPLLLPFVPYSSLFSSPFRLEVGPLNPATGSVAEPQPKLISVNFSFKIWHFVAEILIIFQRINLPKFVKIGSGPYAFEIRFFTAVKLIVRCSYYTSS